MAALDRGAGEWIELNLGAPTRFNTVTLKPFEDRIGTYRIQYRSGDDWRDAYAGSSLGSSPRQVSFPAVTAERVRLLVLSCRASPALWEFEVSHRPTPPGP
jgi:hypothetical protein